jgi:hypothetical protein
LNSTRSAPEAKSSEFSSGRPVQRFWGLPATKRGQPQPERQKEAKMSIIDSGSNAAFTGVFVQTNEQGANRVLAFRRSGGRHALEPPGEYPTCAGPVAAHLTHDADTYQRVGFDA